VSAAGSAYHARMVIYLDDQATELTGTGLAEILDSASEVLSADGRVVVEVMIDGKAIMGTDLGDHQNAALDDSEVRLTSADPKELAVSTLTQVREQLPLAGTLHEQAAEQLQADNPSEALQHIAEAIDVWMMTQEAVLGAAGVVGLGLDDVKVDGEPISAFTEELIQQLNGLKDLIVSKDTVALADALAYEWPAIVQRWDELIETLIAAIKKM
jgi:hypothetical protein